MPMPQPPGKEYRIRSLRRGDRDVVFRLLAAEGWLVAADEQETVLSWVVQHPEMESFVAHEAAAFSRVIGLVTMSHRPQLRLGGRVAFIDLFVVAEQHRGTGVGTDLLQTVLRRTEALGCKRVELTLPATRDGRHDFFEQHGFVKQGDELFARRNPPIARK
jgi:GNAT superfamily N-acetyltransferase